MNDPKDSPMVPNRTGGDFSPRLFKETIEGAETLTQLDSTYKLEISRNRIETMSEVEPIGSVPLPGTLKGVASTGLQILQGNKPQVLIDKLGERLAFERTGTRLYDALISKHLGATHRDELPALEILEEFREDEYSHFVTIAQVMRQIGADPTAVTPSANISSVASCGILQVLTDPRTSFAQCLEAILIAEAADKDCWEVLIKLSDQAGLKDASSQFREALEDEKKHLSTIRSWVKSFVLHLPLKEISKKEAA